MGLLTTYYLLLTTYCLLRRERDGATYYLLRTTCSLLLARYRCLLERDQNLRLLEAREWVLAVDGDGVREHLESLG